MISYLCRHNIPTGREISHLSDISISTRHLCKQTKSISSIFFFQVKRCNLFHIRIPFFASCLCKFIKFSAIGKRCSRREIWLFFVTNMKKKDCQESPQNSIQFNWIAGVFLSISVSFSFFWCYQFGKFYLIVIKAWMNFCPMLKKRKFMKHNELS